MDLTTLLPDLTAFPLRRKYLIGVSGGCDSMLLLHALLARGYQRLVVCHLNHRLRGRASEGDARLVQTTAQRLGITFLGESTDVAAFAKETKQSLETAARVVRQDFFGRCATAERCYDLFLAHHANDQAETVLMNVLRGTGLRGLGGMREVTKLLPAGSRRALTLIRPLLGCWREDLRAMAAAESIEFREDASSQSSDHLRNRLRHELLPLA
ncbi:MAG: tRNA lysidine(34) synthetase TilS, partial [Verrucomicrobiaceae bacterium]